MAMTTPNPGLPLWPLYVQCARRGSGLFGGDSKQLVDMVASTGDPRTVLERLDASDCSDESLLALVSECFRPPGTDLEDVYPGDVASTSSGGANRPFSRESLLQLLRSLTKRAVVNENTYSTLIPAPNPFVIPAGRFRESYYWDSYWIILGLLSCPDQWAADLCIGIVTVRPRNNRRDHISITKTITIYICHAFTLRFLLRCSRIGVRIIVITVIRGYKTIFICIYSIFLFTPRFWIRSSIFTRGFFVNNNRCISTCKKE